LTETCPKCGEKTELIRFHRRNWTTEQGPKQGYRKEFVHGETSHTIKISYAEWKSGYGQFQKNE